MLRPFNVAADAFHGIHRLIRAVLILTESLATSLRCGWCLLDLTRVKSGRACHQPRHGRGVLR